ncbi:MAG: peptide-methionine (S)-S-oxide reductase MsrA [Proteobacteria bacterium]|nr:peptide-methionine (S)-S-oxide reductase MsrA [Pseudomonadota bacterium]
MPKSSFLAAAAVLTGLFASWAMTSDAIAASKSAIFAGGCFWCVEADFDSVPGVLSTTSGYIGGSAKTASYKAVSAGGTGHYEAVKIVYDPARVSYDRLVHIFWRSVDPTDAGGQFCDRGSSYKTGIFTMNEAERKIARASKNKAAAALGQKIVTRIVNAGKFYKAEAYHQNYYTRNPIRYKVYRYGCGRNKRLRALWGGQALAGITH